MDLAPQSRDTSNPEDMMMSTHDVDVVIIGSGSVALSRPTARPWRGSRLWCWNRPGCEFPTVRSMGMPDAPLPSSGWEACVASETLPAAAWREKKLARTCSRMGADTGKASVRFTKGACTSMTIQSSSRNN